MRNPDARVFLERLFAAAVAAADPGRSLAAFLPQLPGGRTVVVGAGKASGRMAQAFERLWPGPLSGIVVVPYGASVACERIRIVEAAHPVPDAAGLVATRLLFEAIGGLSENDLVVALMSGGGSALLPAPAGGLTLEDEIAVNRVLLASGAPISIMNAIRKHVSRIKGGRLAAAAYPARVVTLIVSDVPGDDPAEVASGPTVAGPEGRADALAAIERYGIELPAAVMDHIRSESSAAPTPDDPRLARNIHHIVASASVSLNAAAKLAESEGVAAAILSDSIEGEAREVARVLGAIAREIARSDRPFARPVILLSGGETSVTLRGGGKGGRNTEFLLSLAMDIAGTEGVHALAADTDGIDGTGDNAGAFADGGTIHRMRLAGIDPAASLARNDAWSAFSATGDLFITGPTGTNVNDFRAILVD